LSRRVAQKVGSREGPIAVIAGSRSDKSNALTNAILSYEDALRERMISTLTPIPP
jgi:hypothetical protein